MYNAPRLSVFDMELDQVVKELQDAQPVTVDDLARKVHLLYRHAELALEIANAQSGMWYIGYDGLGSYQIIEATHTPVYTELSGIWLAPGCNFLGILGPYTSEQNAQAIVDEALAEVETEDVIQYILEL